MAGNILNNNLFCGKTGDVFVQFVRYIFSGAVAFVADKTAFLVLLKIYDFDKFLATSIGFTLGLLITYFLSIFWIFNQRKLKNGFYELLIFTIIGIIGLGLMNLFMWVFTAQRIGFDPFTSNLFSTALVTLWNFIAKKYILFTKYEKNERFAGVD